MCPHRSTEIQGSRFLEGLDEGIVGQQQKAEAAPGSASSLPPHSQGPAGSCPAGTSPPLQPPEIQVPWCPRPPFLATQHCWSVPSTRGGDEGTQLPLQTLGMSHLPARGSSPMVTMAMMQGQPQDLGVIRGTSLPVVAPQSKSRAFPPAVFVSLQLQQLQARSSRDHIL